MDDIDAKITHVVRGEDHVTNSGAQIEIFQALGGDAPAMAHTPLLVGAGWGWFVKTTGVAFDRAAARGWIRTHGDRLLARENRYE